MLHLGAHPIICSRFLELSSSDFSTFVLFVTLGLKESVLFLFQITLLTIQNNLTIFLQRWMIFISAAGIPQKVMRALYPLGHEGIHSTFFLFLIQTTLGLNMIVLLLSTKRRKLTDGIDAFNLFILVHSFYLSGIIPNLFSISKRILYQCQVQKTFQFSLPSIILAPCQKFV